MKITGKIKRKCILTPEDIEPGVPFYFKEGQSNQNSDCVNIFIRCAEADAIVSIKNGTFYNIYDAELYDKSIEPIEGEFVIKG